MNLATASMATITLVMLAAVVMAAPWIAPHAVVLGVRVPSARVADPAVVAAVRRFRQGVAGAFAAAVAVLGLAAVLPAEAALSASFAVLVAASAASYLGARAGIVRAKAEGDWYAGVQTRLVGSISDGGHGRRAALPFGWFAASIVVLTAAAVVGIVEYDTLPARVATHWGMSGEADAFAAKGFWSVFGQLLVAAGVSALLLASALLARVAPVKSSPSLPEAANADRALRVRTAISAMLGQLMLIVAAAVAWMSVVGWVARDVPGLIDAGAGVMLALLAVSIGAFMLRWKRIASPAGRGGGRGDGQLERAEQVEPVDDDVHWKLGVVYINRDDPSLFVQKRLGIGWTVNFGSPAGLAVGIAVLALVVAGIVVGGIGSLRA